MTLRSSSLLFFLLVVVLSFVQGIMYEKGEGCTMDKKKAFEMYIKSSELGDAFAQCHLGIYFISSSIYINNSFFIIVFVFELIY